MATQEERNLENFDRLDFEGWNGPDWDTFRELHTDDVIVEFQGGRTEGLDSHVAMFQPMLEASPEMKVTAHPIKIAQGEWTAVVGELPGGAKMVTVARWRDGAIAEEYLFMGGAQGGEQTAS